MTAAYWCILVVVLLPYFLSVAARSAVPRSTYVADPRAYSETLTGWRRRAHLAHLNAFEAVPAVIAGVVVGELAQAPRLHVDALAVAFVCARLAHAALPWLKRRGGTLVAFASDAGRFAAPRQTMIGASRAAIIGFVRNLAVEAARDRVRVHCLSPSFVAGTRAADRSAPHGDRAERAAAKAGLGLPTPADIAPIALFLCGDDARRITGQVISINGGMNA